MDFRPSSIPPINNRRITIVPPPVQRRNTSIVPPIQQRRQSSVVPPPPPSPKRRSTMKPNDVVVPEKLRRPSSIPSMFDEGDSYEDSAESVREALSNIIMTRKCWPFYAFNYH